jgi:hypothetical protein
MDLTLHPTWKQSQSNERIESALVITYKAGTLGDVPSTEVLIKDRSIHKHPILTGGNNGKHDLVKSAIVPSKATHQ